MKSDKIRNLEREYKDWPGGCVEHKWPSAGNSNARSTGEIHCKQCNNCLAIKIVQIWDVWTEHCRSRVRHIDVTVIGDPR